MYQYKMNISFKTIMLISLPFTVADIFTASPSLAVTVLLLDSILKKRWGKGMNANTYIKKEILSIIILFSFYNIFFKCVES